MDKSFKSLLNLSIVFSSIIITMLVASAISEKDSAYLAAAIAWMILAMHDFALLMILHKKEKEKKQVEIPQPKEPFELGEKVVCKTENVIATLEDAGIFQGKVVYGIRYGNGDKIYRYAEDIEKYENKHD